MTAPIKAWIPEDLYNSLRELVRTTSGLTMSRVIRNGMEIWLTEVESERWDCKDWQGQQFDKPAGSPYPARTGDLPTGRPPGGQEGEGTSRVISFRVDDERYDRIYNAAYWRNEYLSHIAKTALEYALAGLKR